MSFVKHCVLSLTNLGSWIRIWGYGCAGAALFAGGARVQAMGRDQHLSHAQELKLEQVLSRLDSTPTGHLLLQKARKLWVLGEGASIRPYLSWGAASKTDAVLTRSFDPITGQERRNREVRISLRSDADASDLLLDLAHELVHATTPPQWDPYDPHLTASKYVWNALEGPGGEVEAVYYECATAIELRAEVFERASSEQEVSVAPNATWKRCLSYLDQSNPSGSPRRAPSSVGSAERLKQRILEDFYRAGPYRDQVLTELVALGDSKDSLPQLSDHSVRLYSSTGSAPYPLALLREFGELNRVACQNSERRLATAQSHSEPSPHQRAHLAALREFLRSRCP